MAKASARHILVPTEEACNDLKTKIEGGEDFAAVAKEHSGCPSGQQPISFAEPRATSV